MRDENLNPRPALPRRCIWCDSLDHQQRDSANFQNSLRRDIVYLSDNEIHSLETRHALNTNFGRGGMMKLMKILELGFIQTYYPMSTYYSIGVGVRVWFIRARV